MLTLELFGLGVTNLKSNIIHGRITDCRDIVKQALQIDEMFVAAFAQVGSAYTHNVCAHEVKAGSDLPAYVYLHRNTMSAMDWNSKWTRPVDKMKIHPEIGDPIRRGH